MVRLIVSVFVGAVITFFLFVLMAELISNSKTEQEKIAPPPVIDIIMDEPDETTQTRTRVPPPPPPPPEQPPKVQPTEPDVTEADGDGLNFDLPSVDVGGASFDIGAPGAIGRDGDATPIVRINPKYPIEAARDGREGWVKLSFTINEVGGVEDVKVIDAEPKRIFNREAQRALRRWKYRPKIVDGVAVRRPGLEVQLDFKLEQ
jgi:protein TonB